MVAIYRGYASQLKLSDHTRVHVKIFSGKRWFGDEYIDFWFFVVYQYNGFFVKIHLALACFYYVKSVSLSSGRHIQQIQTNAQGRVRRGRDMGSEQMYIHRSKRVEFINELFIFNQDLEEKLKLKFLVFKQAPFNFGSITKIIVVLFLCRFFKGVFSFCLKKI